MTKKQRRTEIIKNLTHTIESETSKPTGNMELVAKLVKKLETIKDGTFVSKMRKRRVQMRKLIYGLALFTIAQIIIWIQTNGQFVWPWFKRNPILISLFGGTFISYTFIVGTALVAEYFEGKLWPGRFIGQASGIIVFAFMTWVFLNEGINTKTTISLILATMLFGIQIFWK